MKEIMYNSPLKNSPTGPAMELVKKNKTYSLIRPKGSESEGVLVLNVYLR